MPGLHWAGQVQGDRDVPLHGHRQVELVLCVEGRIWIDVEHRSLEASPGSLLILPPFIPHRQRTAGAWRTWCFLCSVEPGRLSTMPRVLETGGDPYLAAWLSDLMDMHAGRDVAGLDALLLAIVGRLGDDEGHEAGLPPSHPAMTRALNFIRRNLDRRLHASELRDAAHMSYSHLSALFRQRLGCAPLRYHQRLRMERAARLLLNPYCSVDEVAQQSGFVDLNYFVRLFRQTYGLPPGQWRKTRGTLGSSPNL